METGKRTNSARPRGPIFMGRLRFRMSSRTLGRQARSWRPLESQSARLEQAEPVLQAEIEVVRHEIGREPAAALEIGIDPRVAELVLGEHRKAVGQREIDARKTHRRDAADLVLESPGKAGIAHLDMG